MIASTLGGVVVADHLVACRAASARWCRRCAASRARRWRAPARACRARRGRGSAARSAARGPSEPGSQRSTKARDVLGEADEDHGERHVEEHVEVQHLAARVARRGARAARAATAAPARRATQPASLKSRLPKATRRPPPGGARVHEQRRAGRCRGSRRAPGRAPPAPRPRLSAASVAASSTTARLDHEITAKAAPISMSSIGSPESVREDHAHAVRLGDRARRRHRRAAARGCMRPRPMQMRPIWPARVSRRDEEAAPRRR